MPRSDCFTPGKNPVPTVEKVAWAPGPVWKGAENLAPNGFRSPDHRVAKLTTLSRQRCHFCIFRKSVEKIEVSFISEKNNEYFT
jgi:hypothetical protein